MKRRRNEEWEEKETKENQLGLFYWCEVKLIIWFYGWRWENIILLGLRLKMIGFNALTHTRIYNMTYMYAEKCES